MCNKRIYKCMGALKTLFAQMIFKKYVELLVYQNKKFRVFKELETKLVVPIFTFFHFFFKFSFCHSFFNKY